MDSYAVTTVVGSGHHLPAHILEVAHTTLQLHSLSALVHAMLIVQQAQLQFVSVVH